VERPCRAGTPKEYLVFWYSKIIQKQYFSKSGLSTKTKLFINPLLVILEKEQIKTISPSGWNAPKITQSNRNVLIF
jgi:hypothetical protein